MDLELLDIHKHYVQKKANDGISLKVRSGFIHGILGENGAGKSTLMKILSGFITKTKGTILLNGKEADYRSPVEASSLGIGMLYQDPLDFISLNVLENFMAGQASGLMFGSNHFNDVLSDLINKLNFHLKSDSPVKSLTVGERQQLEIMRLLSLGVRVLILDEPTTGISATQKETLFTALRELAREDRSVILVSHKLEDVEALCDEVTVLREGRVTGTARRPFNTDKLLEMMFGNIPNPAKRNHKAPGAEILRLDNVSASGGRTGLVDCTISVKRGEVVGLAGLEGSGQDAFLRVASGLVKPLYGRVMLDGVDLTGRDYHEFKRAGAAFQPSSRIEEGLISALSITEHCALQRSGESMLVDWGKAFECAREKISRFKIVGKPYTDVDSLSGGNQQRLLLSFLPEKSDILLLENPTRGLDLESVRWVWEYLDSYTANGCSIVFSSSELDEILMVADRVLVFFEGRIIKDERPEETSLMDLGMAVAGKV